ncbi:MAG TPA: hypothetical protein VGP88_01135, partial [Thermoplasmata archaeon]|nr:hypothetical protein [Thermoplasmata archaeon]
MSYSNDSVCSNATGVVTCGAIEQLYLNSSDNGTTFSAPALLTGNVTPYYSFYAIYLWPGAYSSVAVRGSNLYLGYAEMTCPGWNSSTSLGCAWGSAGTLQVTVSEPFNGTGVTVTFHARGLNASVPWSVSLLGVNRSAGGTSPVAFGGVPSGEPLMWEVPSVNVSGTVFIPVNGSFGFGNFTTSQSIVVSFTEVVVVNVGVSPLPGSVFGFQTSLTVLPTPGPYQALLGAPFPLNVTANTCLFCDQFVLRFLSWSGTGAGSYSGLSPNVSIVPTGPVTEVANFLVEGYCVHFPTASCQNYSAGMNFVENGLPNGTLWSVTFNGTTLSNTTTTISDANVTAGVYPYAVWTVPAGLPGQAWVGTPSVPSPLLSPATSLVVVTFARVHLSSETFPFAVNTTGLPTGSDWALELGNASYGAAGPSLEANISGGTSVLINGTVVLGPSGIEYRVASVTSSVGAENSSGAATVPAPARDFVNGTTWVTLHYLPYDRVTVSATAGGTAGPASQWVAVGRSTNLAALPMAGYRFQGWSGTVVGTLENLSFVVNVPSHEVAAFRPIPAPTWTVTLATPGLPTGLNATFALGADRFSGSAGSAFENLSTGWYSLAAANVTDPSGGARYVVVSTALAPGGAPNGSALLNANATLTISFRTEYLLTIVAVGGGTTTPVPGAEWVNASAPVDLTAVPDGGRRFLGWTGLGPGHVDSASSAVAVTLTGAVTESASFAVRPPPVRFPYNLTVAETGLPPGTPWSVTGAGAGGAGDGTSIVLPRLNGTYTIVTGP